MTTIVIVPDNPQDSPTCFRATVGESNPSGATVGQALDALHEQLVLQRYVGLARTR